MLADWRTAAIDEGLRAMLGFLEKLTLDPDAVSPADLLPVRAAGVSDAKIHHAIHVAAIFNTIDRIADTFEFHVPTDDEFRKSGKGLLKRGYV